MTFKERHTCRVCHRWDEEATIKYSARAWAHPWCFWEKRGQAGVDKLLPHYRQLMDAWPRPVAITEAAQHGS